jgi:hypothetical protein
MAQPIRSCHCGFVKIKFPTGYLVVSFLLLVGCAGDGSPTSDGALGDDLAIGADLAIRDGGVAGADLADAPALATPPDLAAPGPDCATDVLAALSALPGVAGVTESPSNTTGYRFFTMTFDQPADHKAPAGVHFQQLITLMHRSCTAPVVVFNTGYSASALPWRTGLTRDVNGNQIIMEHRFFGDSRPSPTDWTKLDVLQAATDQHRIIAAFKMLYRNSRWLTYGGSKGGVTSIFHRRFFPDDVDGTVAVVAPLIYAADALPGPNNRYIKFLDEVGGPEAAACRQALRDFQRIVLTRRQAMLDRLGSLATAKGITFDTVLGVEKTLEFATEELPFVFWQYGDSGQCASIPTASASDDAVFSFLDNISDLGGWSDASMAPYLPFYYQSANELGYPLSDESHLTDLLTFPGQDQPPAYLPAGLPVPTYSDATVRDIQDWVRTQGRQILLVYGQNDPWSAGAIELGAAKDSFRFFVPNANHGTSYSTLPDPDRASAYDAISRWAGVPTMLRQPLRGEPRSHEADLPRRRMF